MAISVRKGLMKPVLKLVELALPATGRGLARLGDGVKRKG
jgi:hypothetical protein